MMLNKELIFGTVTHCDADNNLTVALENGETGRVCAAEIGRREFREGVSLDWMIGRRYGYYAGAADEEGCRTLSGKAYENDLYDEIVRRFRAGERNVYAGHLRGRTTDGQIVFYELAQGVNGALHKSDFCYSRIPGFNGMETPRDITVVIKNVDELGRIQLSAKPAFGDFAANISKLGLDTGSVVDGYVTSHIQANGDAVISIAPNVTLLGNPAPLNQHVKVQICRIDTDLQRLKGQVIELCGTVTQPFRYDEWSAPADQLPAYIDVAAFERRIGPRSRTATPAAPVSNVMQAIADASDTAAEISYDNTAAAVACLAFRPEETCVRAPLNGSTRSRMVAESQQGLLTDNHMMIALAVNELKYATLWQIQRYLHLKRSVMLSETTIQSALNRLTRLDILHSLHFSLNGGRTSPSVYYPGATMFQPYTGQYRHLPDFAYTAEPNPGMIKSQLSVNHLLLGMMHCHRNYQSVDSSVVLTNGTALRFRPAHRIVTEKGGTFYLEAVRSNWHNEMLAKLKRYDMCFRATGEKASVVLTLQSEAEIAAFIPAVVEQHFSFPVLLTFDSHCFPTVVEQHFSYPVLDTCDHHCFPTVVTHEIPAWRPDETVQSMTVPETPGKLSGFFSRIWSRRREQKSA